MFLKMLFFTSFLDGAIGLIFDYFIRNEKWTNEIAI